MILVGSPTAEPMLDYSEEELALGWQLYGEELMKGRDPEELWARKGGRRGSSTGSRSRSGAYWVGRGPQSTTGART
jgi:hypothetical protein